MFKKILKGFGIFLAIVIIALAITPFLFKDKIKELVHSSLGEAKKKKKEEDVAPQEDIEMDATEEMPEDTMAPESTNGADINPTVKSIQDSLQRAFAQAKTLGDAKLATQIGNTLTMLMRDQVLGLDKQAVAESEDKEGENTEKLVGMFIDIQYAIEAPFETGMEFEITDEEYDKLMAANEVARQLEIKYGGKKYGIGAIMPDNK